MPPTTKMTFNLPLTPHDAAYIERLLREDKSRAEKWITGSQVSLDEREQAQDDYARAERLLMAWGTP